MIQISQSKGTTDRCRRAAGSAGGHSCLIRFARRAVAGLGLLLCLPPVASADSDALAATQTALEKWVETKQLISRERHQSIEAEELLRARIALLQTREQEVRDRTSEILGELAQSEGRRAELEAENVALTGALELLAARVANLEARVLGLLKAVPEPLRKRAEVLSQQFPKDAADTDLPLSIRYQNLIGVLNMMNAFNNEVTLSTEVRQLDTESLVEVRVLYFGLGQAYFCNKDGRVAGVGLPSEDGWQWQRQDAIGPPVSSLMAQYMNEKTPGFEALPVTIDDLGGIIP